MTSEAINESLRTGKASGADEGATDGASATILSSDWTQLAEPVPAFAADPVGPVTHLMHILWLIREDLKTAYRLEDPFGRYGYLAWFEEYARKEYALAPWMCPAIDLERARAALPPPAPAQRDGEGEDGDAWSGEEAMLLGIWRGRPDLVAAYPPDTDAGWRGFLGWMAASGAREYSLSEATVAHVLRRRGAWGLYARLLAKIARRRLAERGVASLVAAGLREARRIVVPAPGRSLPKEGGPDVGAAPPAVPEEGRGETIQPPPPIDRLRRRAVEPAELLPKGITLVGYARGELGIGEDVRTAARAMDRAAVPFSVLNFHHGLGSRQGDGSADRWLGEGSPYRANLFCMAGMEMPRAFLTLGPKVFDGRYNIGYWPWELPAWPEACRSAFAFVDEVWASTRFAEESIRASSPVPVHRMPLAVTVEKERDYARSEFGLPEDRFLFLFSFDFRSFIARKNPFACVEAFLKAFPRGDEPAGLVVKVMNADPGNPNWRRFAALADGDPRINIIDRTLDRGAMIGLVDCCDSFLSLHRSEGFGRGPAEAMLLGKPVVVTGFSGNMDFCSEETACIVDYRLVPVGPGEYAFGEGQSWADADISHAAHHMERLVADPAAARRLGEAAKAHMETHHSPEAVGRNYKTRLETLGLI